MREITNGNKRDGRKNLGERGTERRERGKRESKNIEENASLRKGRNLLRRDNEEKGEGRKVREHRNSNMEIIVKREGNI